jgi:hypothetical protein
VWYAITNIRFPHNNPDTGYIDHLARHITFQYIPLKQLLKHILESTGFMRAVLEYQPSADGFDPILHPFVKILKN